MHLRRLSLTLVSLQVSHSSRTRACDLKVNLHAILSLTPLDNSMPLTLHHQGKKRGRKLTVSDGLTLEYTICQKVCSSSMHWCKLCHRFQKLWHMLNAFHRLSTEGLSDRVQIVKSRSSTSTSLRPTMFFFLSWLASSHYRKQAWN